VEKIPLIESEEVKFSLFFHKWTGIAWSVQRFATGWMVPGSNPDGGEIFLHPSRPVIGPTQPPIQWVLGPSWG